ncbi:MAG: cyclic nucleotide-binding domain-containing protein [Spirochaetes bacterium]|nr:cyclic nucleotide-binding domain-containing protein [Spirochaetota bacterium]
MDKKLFKKGDIIVREGESGSGIYFIVSGNVKVYKTINREKIEMATLGPNNLFGEMCLISDKHRSATVEALEDTEILITDKDNLIKLMDKHPEKAVKIIMILIQRLYHAHDIISQLQGEKATSKIMYQKTPDPTTAEK